MLRDTKTFIPGHLQGELHNLSNYRHSLISFIVFRFFTFSTKYILVTTVILFIIQYISYEILGPYRSGRIMLPLNIFAIFSYIVVVFFYVVAESFSNHSFNITEKNNAERSLTENLAFRVEFIIDSPTFALPHDEGIIVITDSENGGAAVLSFSFRDEDTPIIFQEFENVPSSINWLEIPAQDNLIDLSYSERRTKLRCRYFSKLDIYMMLRLDPSISLWRLELDDAAETIERRLMTSPFYIGTN
jgi:hypothetical protein